MGKIWRDIAPFDDAAILALTVLLAMVVPFVVNRLFGETEAANRWATKNETARGKILREALEQGVLVEVSTANRQSVVGFIENETPDFEGDISLSPELSGHRHPTTDALVITAEYESAGDDFRVVLLAKDATSVRHFDPDSPYVKWEFPDVPDATV